VDYLSGAWLLLFLIALAVAEFLLYLRLKQGWPLYVGMAMVLFVALTALAYFTEGNTWSMQQQPMRLAIVIGLQVVAPLLAIACAVPLVVRVRHRLSRHALMAAFVFVVMLAWPLYALVVVCTSGLDCV